MSGRHGYMREKYVNILFEAGSKRIRQDKGALEVSITIHEDTITFK